MIVKVFENINMRNGAAGLNEILKNSHVKGNESEMFLFLNKKKHICKILWNGQYVLQINKDRSEAITLEELRAIPGYFTKRFVTHGMQSRISDILGKRLAVKSA